MSLNATNFVNQGPIRSADMKQFVDLFTGVMTDQPVTFKNAMLVGGSQGNSTAPLKLFGVTGQSGNLIELYPTTASANPTFGFGALGNFAWGPGSPAANDTFLSRIALQNGHATDTAGLLIQPYLEVAGNVKADGWVFGNQATLTAPGATPFLLVINQDLTINRDLLVGRHVGIGIAATFTGAALVVQPKATDLLGTTQFQLIVNGTFSTAATAQGTVIQAGGTIPAGMTMTNLDVISIGMVGATAGSTVTTTHGLMVNDVGGTGKTTVYGVYIAAQTVNGGTPGNGLYNEGVTYLAGNLDLGANLNMAGGSVNAGLTAADFNSVNSRSWITSLNGTIYLPDGTSYITQGGGYMYVRCANGLLVQDSVGAYKQITCGGLNTDGGNTYTGMLLVNKGASGTLVPNSSGAMLAFMPQVGPVINLYDAGGGATAGIHIASGQLGMTLLPGWALYWRQSSAGGQHISWLDYGGQMGCLANFSPYALATQNPGYAISTVNTSAASGQVLAYAHPLWSCVAHAQEYGLRIEALTDATSLLNSLSPYRYEHLNTASGEPMRRDGKMVTTMTYGFHADEVRAAIPEAASVDNDGVAVGVDDYRLLCVLWTAVQEMSARLDKLAPVA